MNTNLIAKLAVTGMLALMSLFIPTYQADAQTELRPLATQIVKEMAKDPDVAPLKGKKLLVAEFDNISGKADGVPHAFEGMLTTAIVSAKQFKVVDRALLEKTLKKLGLGFRGLSDPDNAKKIGKQLGVGFMVVGDISDIDGRLSIDARIIRIDTFECVAACYASNTAEGEIKVVGQNTSLIVNAGEFKLKRTMCPKIRLTDGTEIWGSITGDIDWISENGLVSYAFSLEDAKADKRAGNNPLIIQAIGVYGNQFSSDPVIDEADVKLILDANKDAKFLNKYNVIFVTK